MTYLSVTLNGEEVQGYTLDYTVPSLDITNREAAMLFALDLQHYHPVDRVSVNILASPPADIPASLSDHEKYELVEVEWNAVSNGELDLSGEGNGELAELVLRLWDEVESYTSTVDTDTEDIDVRGPSAIARRIAEALLNLWFGVRA